MSLQPFDRHPMRRRYLDRLNPEQRRAVEHGAGEVARRAAAGHRRRRLGQDQHARPSRRPSGGQRRRSAAHPADDLLAPRRRRDDPAGRADRRHGACRPRSAPPALDWAGTFHGIGARLLREYAERIGLDPAFTIHDREDSADLMNLVRHELGLSHTEKRFPDQGDLPGDLFARGQRGGASWPRCCAQPFPGAPAGRTSSQRLFARLCRGQAEPERARLRRPAALLGGDAGGARARRGDRRALRPRAGRRIPGHQPPAGLDPAGAEARRARAVGGRRRRAVDLFVPRRDGAQHPRFSQASSARRPRS